MKKGWFQVGFVRDFESDITCVDTADGPLMVIKRNNELCVYSAICPHRGANLARGGTLVDQNGVRCPFHGCVVGLDCSSSEGYELTRIHSMSISSLLFVNTDSTQRCGFDEYISEIDETHFILPGFQMEVRVDPKLVIENAFDQMHFRTVHAILNEPEFTLLPSRDGEFGVEGSFVLPVSPWQRPDSDASGPRTLSVPYEARAFSPYLVISELKGENRYHIITSAIKLSNGCARIFLSLAIPNERFDPGEGELYQYLLRQSQRGIELDKVVWENQSPTHIDRFQKRETAVIGFQSFCNRFVDVRSR